MSNEPLAESSHFPDPLSQGIHENGHGPGHSPTRQVSLGDTPPRITPEAIKSFVINESVSAAQEAKLAAVRDISEPTFGKATDWSRPRPTLIPTRSFPRAGARGNILTKTCFLAKAMKSKNFSCKSSF